jgi:hypothetical protein
MRRRPIPRRHSGCGPESEPATLAARAKHLKTAGKERDSAFLMTTLLSELEIADASPPEQIRPPLDHMPADR